MRTRELSEKELQRITKIAGEFVRAQSVEIRLKVKKNLQRAFAAVRRNAKPPQPTNAKMVLEENNRSIS